MQRGSPAASIIGGAGLLAMDVWAVSMGRLPVWGYFRGPLAVDAAATPKLFWASITAIACIGVASIVWGLVASMHR